MKRRSLLQAAAASAAGLILPPWLLAAAPARRVFSIQTPVPVELQSFGPPPVGSADPVVRAHARAIEILREQYQRDLLLGRKPVTVFQHLTRLSTWNPPPHLRRQFEEEYGIDRRMLDAARDLDLRRVFG